MFWGGKIAPPPPPLLLYRGREGEKNSIEPSQNLCFLNNHRTYVRTESVQKDLNGQTNKIYLFLYNKMYFKLKWFLRIWRIEVYFTRYAATKLVK